MRFQALGHPLRLRMLALIRGSGPMTATEVGRETGQSAANCSFHLRVLAKGGFIEAADGGDGRTHPWQAVSAQLTVDPLLGSLSERESAQQAVEALRGNDRELLLRWDQSRQVAPGAWRDASFEKSAQLHMTPSQLSRLEMLWERAITEATAVSEVTDGDSAELVQLQMVGFPTRADW